MKPSLVRVQLAIFFTAAIGAILYATFGLVGVKLFDRPFEVSVQLERAGGLFEGSEVTYRGVKVGNVEEIRLDPDGVRVRLSIEYDARIPSDTDATVRRFSVAGEQYIDLTGGVADGQYLAAGDRIDRERTGTPPDFARVLADLSAVTKSVDPEDLRTVTRELGAAFADSGDDLSTIIDSSTVLVGELKSADQQLTRLLENSQTVLDTVNGRQADVRSIANDAPLVSEVLADRAGNLEEILVDGLAAARSANGVLKDNETSGPALFEDLATISRIQQGRLEAWKVLLRSVDSFARDFPLLVRDNAIQAYATFDYTQPVCSLVDTMTSPLSKVRSPLELRTCKNPEPGTLLRGAQNVPN